MMFHDFQITFQNWSFLNSGALGRLAKNIQQKPEPIVTEMLKILASTSSDQYLLWVIFFLLLF